MIDMHSHILPGIDDGSNSIEESIEMLREAKNAGFDSVISTSHYIEEYYTFNENQRRDLLKDIQNNLARDNIDLKLYLGSEIYLSENILNLLKEFEASTINGTSYVLFELPLQVKPMNLYEVIYDMLRNKLVPILAHPERYKFVQESPELVLDLMDKGVLMQSNFASIIGRYGKRAQITVEKLLRNNAVHFLGTDTHKKHSIYTKMPEILVKLEKLVRKSKTGRINCNQSKTSFRE